MIATQQIKVANANWVVPSDADLPKKIHREMRQFHVNINVNSTLAERRNAS